uniref:Putative secreted protein n=1 Tax=Anopheles darlingi TaxID=43151 RepID=A0A2M4DCJ2_ANODA
MILSSLFSCPPLAPLAPATTMGGWMGSPEIPFVQNNASWGHHPRPRTATTRPSPTPPSCPHTHTLLFYQRLKRLVPLLIRYARERMVGARCATGV